MVEPIAPTFDVAVNPVQEQDQLCERFGLQPLTMPPEVFHKALSTFGVPEEQQHGYYYDVLLEVPDMVPQYGDVRFETSVNGFVNWPDIRSFDSVYRQHEKIIAEIGFGRQPMAQGKELIMKHRYVDPDIRKKGVGTQLYVRAEQFLQGIAREMGEDIRLTLGINQPNVMRWVRSLGFDVLDDIGRTKVDDILSHPENYVLDHPKDQFPSDADRDQMVFEVGVRDRIKQNALRFRFEKIISARN